MRDLDGIRSEIKKFLQENRATIREVSKRSTQIFEARSFIAVAHHYLDQNYELNPRQESSDGYFQFKYSPSAYPWNHSYFEVIDPSRENRVVCEIRHNQAVAGRWSFPPHRRNVVKPQTSRFQADIAVVLPGFLPAIEPSSSKQLQACVPNSKLITLAEVKKMSPTPMLIASFQGIIYSIKAPLVVNRLFSSKSASIFREGRHPFPILFSDGPLSRNAKNIVDTILQGQRARISVVTNGMGIPLCDLVAQIRIEK